MQLTELTAQIKFNGQGLVPVIAQQHDSGEVLMLAWMDIAAIEETLTSKRVCYYSRSRQQLWRKGETSGQVQNLIELRLDCDGDTLLALVNQQGVACHTGRRNCFYLTAADTGWQENAAPEISPDDLYGNSSQS